jgi:photosystem II stability/assembly factor-like uncharacterized protein
MKKTPILLLFFVLLISCKPTQVSDETFFKSVKIDTILIDKISIRPITVSSDKVWYAADKNRVGYVSLIDANKMERKINKDSLKLEFRSIAQTSDAIFVLNVGNPALLYKFSVDLNKKTLVYEEKHEKVFYDSMQFWNDKEGIAIGDPIENCFCVIITRDGGNSWNKITCENLPKMDDGEAAFAASNTNIIIKGNNTWLVSGGKKTRVFYSSDKGITRALSLNADGSTNTSAPTTKLGFMIASPTECIFNLFIFFKNSFCKASFVFSSTTSLLSSFFGISK